MALENVLTHTAGYVTDRGPAKLSENPLLAPAERERLEIFEETYRDLEMRGFFPASLIRFAPWTLSLNGAAHSSKRLEGVPIEPDSWATHSPRLKLRNGLSIPFTHHVITAPYITVGTRFRGKGENDSYAEMRASVELPIGLARDMANQQNLYKSQGGVLAYEGAELPQKADGTWLSTKSLAWLTGNESSPSVEKAVYAAFDRLLSHMKATMDQATAAHLSNSKEELREIRGNRFRQAVQYLLNVGVIQTPPSWFTQRFDATSAIANIECPMCSRKVEATRKKCECNYILDPFGAYGKAYTEEDPGGLLTARRMTREQLQTLGLYPRIKPLEEHLKDLDKAATKAKKEDKD